MARKLNITFEKVPAHLITAEDELRMQEAAETIAIAILRQLKKIEEEKQNAQKGA